MTEERITPTTFQTPQSKKDEYKRIIRAARERQRASTSDASAPAAEELASGPRIKTDAESPVGTAKASDNDEN